MRLGISGISISKPDHSVLNRDVRKAKSSRPNHRQTGLIDVTEQHPLNTLQGLWKVDYDCVLVGKGRQAYSRAKEYVRQWKHMDLGWVDTNKPPTQVGDVVVVMGKVLGLLWMRNPMTITFQEEQQATIPGRSVTAGRQVPKSSKKGMRYDIGNTTVEGHSLAGAERFSVQWCKEDDSVWYEILAVSRPATLLAIASYPLARFYQSKFRRDSTAAVQAAVGGH